MDSLLQSPSGSADPIDGDLDVSTITAPLGVVVETRELSDGSVICSAELDLPAGWNKTCARIQFLLPPAFPSAQPDCFYADPDLRLVGGGMPMNTGIQPLDGQDHLWFSWHLSTWSPATDNTLTYLRFIERRLRDAG